jgi:hypothetical protein
VVDTADTRADRGNQDDERKGLMATRRRSKGEGTGSRTVDRWLVGVHCVGVAAGAQGDVAIRIAARPEGDRTDATRAARKTLA